MKRAFFSGFIFFCALACGGAPEALTSTTMTLAPTTTVMSDSSKVTKPNKKPNDRYSCNINNQGFCIFTGQPHQNYLEPQSNTVVNLEGLELFSIEEAVAVNSQGCLLYTSPSPRDRTRSRMPSSA